ncbi:MAG: hypothetical protein PHG47_10685 [Sulfuricella sp.]|nr:hypothetical protein [Sulfuricella sp.]
MSTITFDTLKFVERLKAAGVPESQAMAQSEALKEVLSADVATKHDLTETELRIEAKMESMKYEIIKWNTGTLLAATGIFAAIVKFWH